MTVFRTRFAWILGCAAGLAATATPAPAQPFGEGPSSGLTLSGPWRPGPRLEDPRAGLAAAALDGRVYAAGGAGLVDPRDDFDAFDPDAGVWRGLKPLPVGLERFGMAAAAGRLWVAGGYSAESGADPTRAVWSYDPAADIWQSEPELPGAKAAFTLLAHAGRLYAIGGEDGAPGVFVFDVQAGEWSAVDAPPEVDRRGAAAASAGGRLFLVGGVRSGQATARVDVFDPETGEWTRGPDLPEARAGHAAVAHGAAVHVFGGRSPDLRRTVASHFVLDPGAREWREGPALPEPRTEMAAAVVGSRVVLAGGGVGGGFFAPFTAVDDVTMLTLDDS